MTGVLMMLDTKLARTSHSLNKSAFTLIELVVTVSILAIALGVGIPVYTSYQRVQEVQEARETIKTHLRLIQSKANAGVAAACTAPTRLSLMSWSLKVDVRSKAVQTNYHCFAQGDTGFTTYDTFVQDTYYLPAGVTITVLTELPTASRNQLWVHFLTAGKGILFFTDSQSGLVKCCAQGVTLTVGTVRESLNLIILPSGEIVDG